MKPLLSICIPTYERSRHLELLVSSLSQQIVKAGLEERVEIAISDNDSKDETQETGEKWAARHSFVRYYRNAWNIGGEPNQLRAAERGTGQFAWVLGDDDRVLEGGVARVVAQLHSGVNQLFLNFRCVDSKGNFASDSGIPPQLPDPITTREFVKRVGFLAGFALISSHVFDREKILALGSDFLLKLSPWYVLNTALLIAFHDQPLVIVRDPVLDYTTDNERLPPESAMYGRVLYVLKTLEWLEQNKKIDEEFLYCCHESKKRGHYLREELYGNLTEISGYWALPGREDWELIRRFLQRGPGFWGLRDRLLKFYAEDYSVYTKHKKPVIHYWRSKAWFPAFSLLCSSDEKKECEAFDILAGKWPVEFAHETILISRLGEDQADFKNLDVFMAPFRPHSSPCAALNTGFRKTLAPRVFIAGQVCSPDMPAVIQKIDDWISRGDAPRACLLFASASSAGDGLPAELLGLYLERKTFVRLGGFENNFPSWSRDRLLADAGLRLGAEAWAVNGGKISKESLARWYARQLPGWIRTLRSLHRRPLSEHGLNARLRGHFARQDRQRRG